MVQGFTLGEQSRRLGLAEQRGATELECAIAGSRSRPTADYASSPKGRAC